MSPVEGYLIGEAGTAVGLNAKTIRYYEDLGLLGEPSRTPAGYRVYSAGDIERLRFITGAKALGLTLAQIKDLIGAWSAGERPCGRVRALLDAKLAELEARIAELSHFRLALKSYVDTIDARPSASAEPCAHIAGVTAGDWQPPVETPAAPLTPRKCAADKNSGPLRLVPPV